MSQVTHFCGHVGTDDPTVGMGVRVDLRDWNDDGQGRNTPTCRTLVPDVNFKHYKNFGRHDWFLRSFTPPRFFHCINSLLYTDVTGCTLRESIGESIGESR